MHKHTLRYLALVACSTAAPVHAHGGISALGGLMAAFLVLIGAGGAVLALLLALAVWRAIRNDRSSKWTAAALALGLMYVPFSLFFYFSAQDQGIAKFPGFVAAVVLALLGIFFLRRYQRTRLVALSILGLLTAVMLFVPAQFWKGNAFDVVEIIFVDNSGDLEAMDWNDDRDSKRQLLHLADGRDILQFEYRAGGNDTGDLFAELPGDLVSVQPIDIERGGEWFRITHYIVDPRYRPEMQYAWNRPRHSLFRQTIPMYRPRGQQSIGVLLDTAAEIDSRSILLHVLARSGTRSLKIGLVEAGEIDVNAPHFIDAAFENDYTEAYRFLLSQGLDVNATSSKGESLLHRAAEVADVHLMKLLVQRGANLSAENAQGLTALQYFLQRHGDRPIVMRPFKSAFPDAVPR